MLAPYEKGELVSCDYGFELPEYVELNDYKASSSVGLWLDKQANPSADFLDACLMAGVKPEAADFSDPTSSQQVSDWIKKGTEGLLSPQVQLSPLALACIVSVLYFKDAWFRKFEEEDSRPMVFHAPGGDVEADFMTKVSGATSVHHDDFLALPLPLASDAEMVFALPNEGMDLSGVLRNPKLFESFASPSRYDHLNPRTEIFLPKFESESLFEGLTESLQGIGFSTATSPDVKPITGIEGPPTEIVHGAKISVNEIGVEAAAYTRITLCLGIPSPSPPKPEKVVFDRPFAYAIVSNTGLPLFIGTVNNPTL